MENQVSTIVCPNCGANTTNRRNCEYCGSALVRFADQNVAIDQNVFGKNALSFSSVATALRKNLGMQNDLSPTDVVLTEILNGRKEITRPDIWVYGGNVTSETRYCFVRGYCFNIADVNIPSSSEPRLILFFTTPILEGYERTFKRSCYASLFSSADIPLHKVNEDGTLTMYDKKKSSVLNKDLYYLDMGQDYESATKIITDIYQTIYGVSENEIEVKTEKLSLEQQRSYAVIRDSESRSSGCSVALLPILGIGAGIAAGIVKLISHLLV